MRTGAPRGGPLPLAGPWTTAIPAVNFGASADFAIGIEEELILVDPMTHALDHSAIDVLRRLSVPPAFTISDCPAMPKASKVSASW